MKQEVETHPVQTPQWIATTDGFGHTTITARGISSVTVTVRGGRDVQEHEEIVNVLVWALNA